MLNMYMETIESLNLANYVDYMGYNILEIPFKDYKKLTDSIGAFMLAYPGLGITSIDNYGDIATEDTNEDDIMVIVYNVKEWEENGLI